MTESWRRKTFYAPRVLIKTSDVLDSGFPDGILCLTGGQLNIVRNLLQYAHRRANFVTTYETNSYLSPTEAEWDSIQAIVADLEEQAMNTCTELFEQLEAILAAAACACESAGSGYASPLTGPIYQDLVEAETLVWTPPDGTVTPAEAAACDLAQLVYAWNYEFLTEDLQPIEVALHEVLLAAVIQTIGTVLGGPVGAVSAPGIYLIITKALNAWVEGELAGVVNELVALKNELVCAMYTVFLEEGSYSTAAAAAAEVIDSSTSWSPVDKLLFKATFSPLATAICQSALTAESAWAVANVDPGYCDGCPESPYQGTDWYAVPVYGASWTKTYTASTGYWCLPSIQQAGRYIQGIVYDVTMSHPGNCSHKTMSRHTSGCPTNVGNMFSDSSPSWSPGRWCKVNYDGITESQVQTKYGGTLVATGQAARYEHAEGAFNLWCGSGAWITCTVKYLIFRGTIPE